MQQKVAYRQKFFITGASGSIGQALYSKLSLSGQVIGTARNIPYWWLAKDEFIPIDLSSEKVSIFSRHIDNKTIIIHLLNLTHKMPQKDLKNTLELYELAVEQGARKFIFTSSIRVFSGNFGVVDEMSQPIPSEGDVYGNAKLLAEDMLEQSVSAACPIRICRVGSVFSQKTPQKVPIILKHISRLLDAGRNTHLISANNVAEAIAFVAQDNCGEALKRFNVTQEIDGLNNYVYLGDALLKPSSSLKNYQISFLGKVARNYIARRRNLVHTMPYVTVHENALHKAGFFYRDNLLQSLRKLAHLN